VRYTDPETNLVSPPTPRVGQRPDSVAHFKGHQNGLQRWVLNWHWIVKHNHHPVTGIAFQGTAVLDNARSECLIRLRYAKLAGPAVAPFGARILARGNTAVAREQGLKERTVVVEYPSLEKATAAYDGACVGMADSLACSRHLHGIY
jgi:Domain of unknown function (DUF1330)